MKKCCNYKTCILVQLMGSKFRIHVVYKMRLWRREIGLSPPVKCLIFQGSTSSVDHLCYLCLVFVMLSLLFIAAVGKGLTSWFFFVMFIVLFITFPFGILRQAWYLIVSIPEPCCFSYYETGLSISSNVYSFNP